MWIVDDDGDMFNTDHYASIAFSNKKIKMYLSNISASDFDTFVLSSDLDEEERIIRYYDLVEKLTGVRIDA